MFSMTTDFAHDAGDPAPDLRLIADAGFDAVHWCHHWSSDFLYSDHEIEYIARTLAAYGLAMLDLHASAGKEKRWGSTIEYRRKAGEELVRNRIRMAGELGADVVVLHLPKPEEPADGNRMAAVRSSLDAMEAFARERGVRIALENMGRDDFSELGTLFTEYSPDYIGLCYDCGHGNMGGEGLAHLERHLDRLIAVHLHDNDGNTDQHRLPFSGSVAWDELCGLIASSPYRKAPTIESNLSNTPGVDGPTFLRSAREASGRLVDLIAERRNAVPTFETSRSGSRHE